MLPILSVEEWLYYMKNCSCYIGDSYHALCFSLIFHKPFIIIYAKASGFSWNRFYSLLQLVGLEDRIISNLDEMENCKTILNSKIDWRHVDNVLRNSKEESVVWLKNVLLKKKPTSSPEDYIRDSEKRKMSELRVQVYDQSLRITNLEKMEREKIKVSLFKRGLQCYKDHGVAYTLRRIQHKYFMK